jgi:short-subunit dehydrogenase
MLASRVEDGMTAQSGNPATALVTGASSGIGEALAYRLAGRCRCLVLVSEDEPNLHRVAAELASKAAGEVKDKTEVLVKVLDLCRSEAAGELFSWCCEKGIKVDILANCAGMYARFEDEMKDTDAAEKLLSLHVATLTQLCLMFGREMVKRRLGFILNLSSITAFFPDPASLTYGPSKSYIRDFSRSLSMNWKAYNVKVTCLLPAGVDTGFFQRHGIALPRMVAAHLLPVERCARLALRALFRGKAALVPGFLGKLHLLFFRIANSPLFFKIVKRLYGSIRRGMENENRMRGGAESAG